MSTFSKLLLWVFLCGAASGLRAGEGKFEIRAVAPRLGSTGNEYVLDDGGGDPVKLSLGSEVLLDTSALASAEAKWEEGYWAIEVELTPAGTQRFGEITARFLNRRLAMLINGTLRCAPVVNSAITGGSFEVAGNFTEAEVKALAADLNAAVAAGKKDSSPAPTATPSSP